jgi:hypothetical protein
MILQLKGRDGEGGKGEKEKWRQGERETRGRLGI